MSSRKSVFRFGRLNFIGWMRNKSKYDFMYDSLTAQKDIHERGYNWGFFNIEKVEYNNHLFIYGLLVKYEPQATEETVDKETGKLTSTVVPDKTITKCPFLLHPDSSIIAYNPCPGDKYNRIFENKFSKLFEEANDGLFIDVEIQAINDELTIYEAIREFEKITVLKIKLHPSNPTNRHRWKKVDEKLHRMRVQKYHEYYESKDGIILSEEDDAYAGILMAGDGYGEAEVVGLKNGKEFKASTKRMQITENAPKDKLDDMICKLFPVFTKIFKRFDKDES